MVDRPNPADPKWLKQVEEAFGECQLVPMTAAGEWGIVCQMQVEQESLIYLRQSSTDKAFAIKKALEPLLDEPVWCSRVGKWRVTFSGTFPQTPLRTGLDTFASSGSPELTCFEWVAVSPIGVRLSPILRIACRICSAICITHTYIFSQAEVPNSLRPVAGFPNRPGWSLPHRLLWSFRRHRARAP